MRCFGRDLLARARARGVTGDEVAALLGLPVATIRRLSGAHELDSHATATLRALAERLDLPWPAWLTLHPAGQRRRRGLALGRCALPGSRRPE